MFAIDWVPPNPKFFLFLFFSFFFHFSLCFYFFFTFLFHTNSLFTSAEIGPETSYLNSLGWHQKRYNQQWAKVIALIGGQPQLGWCVGLSVLHIPVKQYNPLSCPDHCGHLSSGRGCVPWPICVHLCGVPVWCIVLSLFDALCWPQGCGRQVCHGTCIATGGGLLGVRRCWTCWSDLLILIWLWWA